MMKIDSHQHFWRYHPNVHTWMDGRMAAIKQDFLPADLAPLLTANGYAGCVAVQASQTLDETAWLLELANQHAFIQGVVGWVDLRSPLVDEQLARFAKHPRLKGVRHVVHDEADDRFLMGDAFQRGLAQLPHFKLSYDLLLFPKHLPVATECVTRHPELMFIVDHLAKPVIRSNEITAWAADLRRLAAQPNVTCKLSGMVTEADWQQWTPAQLIPYLEVALDAFGPQRLMIGSDWPVCRLAGAYDVVMGAVESWTERLTTSERAAILGDNARRIYRL